MDAAVLNGARLEAAGYSGRSLLERTESLNDLIGEDALPFVLAHLEYATHDLRVQIAEAVAVAIRYGGHDGAHHKQWVIDQMLRALLARDYDAEIAKINEDESYFPWDTGIAP